MIVQVKHAKRAFDELKIEAFLLHKQRFVSCVLQSRLWPCSGARAKIPMIR